MKNTTAGGRTSPSAVASRNCRTTPAATWNALRSWPAPASPPSASAPAAKRTSSFTRCASPRRVEGGNDGVEGHRDHPGQGEQFGAGHPGVAGEVLLLPRRQLHRTQRRRVQRTVEREEDLL